MAIIKVPKTPAQAYNPDRPPGTLLQNQLLHLEWAARPAKERAHGTFEVKPAATEREAAERIEKLTRQLCEQPEPVIPGRPADDDAPPRKPAAKKPSKRPRRRRTK